MGPEVWAESLGCDLEFSWVLSSSLDELSSRTLDWTEIRLLGQVGFQSKVETPDDCKWTPDSGCWCVRQREDYPVQIWPWHEEFTG